MRLAVLLIVLMPFSAWAQDDLERAEKLFEDLQYEQAIKLVEEVLKSPRRGPSELVDAYRIKGLCLSALGRSQKALEAFRMLLAIDPDYQLRDVKSPKLNAPFFQAVGMTRKNGSIVLSHQPPEPGPRLAGLVLTANLESDPLNMVKKVRLRFWTENNKPLQMSLEVKGPQVIRMRLPLDFKSDKVNYYFEAVNAYGGVLARQGSWYQPLQLEIKAEAVSALVKKPEEKKKPIVGVATVTPPPAKVPPPEVLASRKSGEDKWYTNWWFWAAVGVVVAGATAGTVLGLSEANSAGSVDCFVKFGVR